MKTTRKISFLLICLTVSMIFNFPLNVKLAQAQQNQSNNTVFYCQKPIRYGNEDLIFVFIKKDDQKPVQLSVWKPSNPHSLISPGSTVVPNSIENLFPELRAQMDGSGKITVTGTTAFVIHLSSGFAPLGYSMHLISGDITLKGMDDCVALAGSAFYSNEKAKQAYVEEKMGPLGLLLSIVEKLISGLRNIQQRTTGNTIAVGDIHGWYQRLRSSLLKIGAINPDNSIAQGKQLVLLGDLIDRAEDPTQQLQTFQWADSVVHNQGTPYLMGNHEYDYIIHQYLSTDDIHSWGLFEIDYSHEVVPKVTDTRVLNRLFSMFEDGSIKLAYAKDGNLYVHAGFTDFAYQSLGSPQTDADAATRLNSMFSRWRDLLIKYKYNNGRLTTAELTELKRLSLIAQDVVWARDNSPSFPRLKTDFPDSVQFTEIIGHTSKSKVSSAWKTLPNGMKQYNNILLVGDDLRGDGTGVYAIESKVGIKIIDGDRLTDEQLINQILKDDRSFFREFHKSFQAGSQAEFGNKIQQLVDVMQNNLDSYKAKCPPAGCSQNVQDIFRMREGLIQRLRELHGAILRGDSETAAKLSEDIYGDFNSKLTDNILSHIKRLTDMAVDAKNKGAVLDDTVRFQIKDDLVKFNIVAENIDKMSTTKFSQRLGEILASTSDLKDNFRSGLKELGARKIGNYAMGAAFALILAEPVISDLGQRTNNSFLITLGLGIRYVGFGLFVASSAVIIAQIVAYVVFHRVLTNLIVEILGVTSIEAFVAWTVIGIILPTVIIAVYCFLIHNDSALCGCNFSSVKYSVSPNPVKPEAQVTAKGEGFLYCEGKRLAFYLKVDVLNAKALASCNVLSDGSCLGNGNAPKTEGVYEIDLVEYRDFLANTGLKLTVSSSAKSSQLQCQQENSKSWLCQAPEGMTVQCTQDTSAAKSTWICKI